MHEEIKAEVGAKIRGAVCRIFAWIVCTILFWIPVLMLEGYVISDIWRMFLVPLGVQSVTMCHAIGLVFLFTCIARRPIKNVNKTNKKATSTTFAEAWSDHFGRSVVYVVGILFSWLGATIVHNFI